MTFRLSRRAMILILLFVFSFSLRLSFLSKGPFHIDALDLALSAQQTLDTTRLHYEHGTGYPLTVILAAVFVFIFKIFGITDAVFCVNVMSAFFGALGVALMYLFVEQLFDEFRALATAVLMACFAPHVAISTFGKSLTLSICFALAAFTFAAIYRREARRSYLFAAALFLGFCAASRLSDAVVAVPLVFLLWQGPGDIRDRFRAIAVVVAVAAATTFVYYLPMLLEYGCAPMVKAITQKNEAAFLGFLSPVLKLSFDWLISSVDPIGILVAISGMGFMALRRRIHDLIFLLVWFFAFQFFYGNVSSSGPRYLVIGWLSLVVAQGYFFGIFKGKALWLSMPLLLITALGTLAQATPFLEFRHRRALQVEYAEWVASKTGPGDLILAVDEGIFLEIYGHRDALIRRTECDDTLMDQFFTDGIDRALAEGRGVYMIGSACSYDGCHKFEKRIKKDYQRIYRGAKMNEDWHHSLLNQDLFREGLWEIKKK